MISDNGAGSVTQLVPHRVPLVVHPWVFRGVLTTDYTIKIRKMLRGLQTRDRKLKTHPALQKYKTRGERMHI